MSKLLSLALATLMLVATLITVAPVAEAGYVNGYYRNNGTYVNGYYRNSSSGSYRSYSTPSYTRSYSYPSYSSGLKYQRGYFKRDGSYTQGHYKTYSDGYEWNNRRNLYGY